MDVGGICLTCCPYQLVIGFVLLCIFCTLVIESVSCRWLTPFTKWLRHKNRSCSKEHLFYTQIIPIRFLWQIFNIIAHCSCRPGHLLDVLIIRCFYLFPEVTVCTVCWEMESVPRVPCGKPWPLLPTTSWTTWWPSWMLIDSVRVIRHPSSIKWMSIKSAANPLG